MKKRNEFMPQLSRPTRILLGLIRFSLGWLYFYAGITKLVNPDWSAQGYLLGAKQFTGFYHALASPALLPFVNFLNQWGLTLLGLSLMLGIGIRLSAPLGALLMLLYYLPQSFPQLSATSYVVDEHVIYACALLLLATLRAGHTSGGALADRFWGLPLLRAIRPLGDILD
jgi:thiosulfate dehydrogenase [quinone] large subunit